MILSIAAALLAGKISFNWFFDDSEDFLESVKMWMTPDIIQILREGTYSFWAEFKIWVWVGISVLIGFAVQSFLVS